MLTQPTPRLLNLASPADYDIATALRGPDSDFTGTGLFMKNYTTAVIRWFAGVPRMGMKSLVVDPESARLEWASLPGRVRKGVVAHWWSDMHFKYHIEDAFFALHDQPLASPYWYWWNTEMKKHHDDAA